jgi:hypothetical protein
MEDKEDKNYIFDNTKEEEVFKIALKEINNVFFPDTMTDNEYNNVENKNYINSVIDKPEYSNFFSEVEFYEKITNCYLIINNSDIPVYKLKKNL